MKKSKTQTKIKKTQVRAAGLAVLVGLLGFSMLTAPFTKADTLQDQINALSADNSQKADQKGVLGLEAASLTDAIGKLQAQIDALQNEIVAKQEQAVQLQAQIVAAQAELDKQKVLLGETIKSMYLEGDTTTLEMLASSKNLSDYFDKAQYHTEVQNKVKTALDKVTQLKAELATQKDTLEKVIAEQTTLRNELDGQRAEQARVLSLNQSQQADLDNQIKTNNSKIADLRTQQRLANLKAGGLANFSPCAGGYPQAMDGRWGCNYPLDNGIDRWGMYNRECVSYAAFKVAASGRYMPYWGGHGNANEWDGNARAVGIPVDRNPRAGDIAVWHIGYYGHVMYVEAVGGDGSIVISEYNYDWTGRYSERAISASQVSAQGLQFIHFR